MVNSDNSPFDTLPHVLRQKLVERVYMDDLTSQEPAPLMWACECWLRTLSQAELKYFMGRL